jgi:DNA-binding transcriptional MerR regulator
MATTTAPLKATRAADLPASGTRPARAARTADPVQEYFSIGEVCSLTALKPHVLRYWETQFRVLNPAKNRSGNRVYARREVELVLLVKHLLYTEKYTVDGARQKLDEHRRARVLWSVARQALAIDAADSVERELRAIIDLLEGRGRPNAGPPLEDAFALPAGARAAPR